jgi:hypothetical protein|tara:strand:- start:134 stop:316 length:183 start_codon:yes stop_codon:yes gene_type:complete
MLWVLVVLLMGTEISEKVYFNDLDTCLDYSKKVRGQNVHQRLAGDKIWVKAYCIPIRKEE